MLRGCTPFSLNSVQLIENVAKLHASHSELRAAKYVAKLYASQSEFCTAKLKCCEAVSNSV